LESPALIVLVGPPGTGKSHLARQIVAVLDARLIQTDAVRKQLFPDPRYTAPEMRSVYAACRCRISAALAAAELVIFDATNLRERSRASLYRLADRHRAGLIVLVAYAPPKVIRQRLARRHRKPDPADLSDADWDVYERMAKTAEPVARPHIVANTCVSPAPLLRLLKRLLAAQWSRTGSTAEDTEGRRGERQ